MSVDGDRLLSRLDRLARIGALPTGGVTREAWGEADVEARTLLARWMREADLDPVVDPVANLVGRRPGRRGRWLASGSHLDTVVAAGPLDGAYGVVAALEAANSLHDAGERMDHGLLVAAFANEEGARGTRAMTGSHACAGLVAETPLDEVDDDGVTVAERIGGAGGDPGRVESARWEVDDIDAFVELHIEQGPVLDAAGVPVGAVSAVTGRQSLDVVVSGAANHAGTTPMDLRADALAAAAEVVLAVEALPRAGGVRVATCGHLAVTPNVRNVVPGRVHLGVELRDEDAARLDEAVPEVEALLAAVATRRGVGIEAVWGQRVPPQACAPAIVDAVLAAAEGAGLAHLVLPSGAGHDAQVIGRAPLPFGMVFVPSLGGVSHSPLESTSPEHLVAGAEVLLRTLLELDRRMAA